MNGNCASCGQDWKTCVLFMVHDFLWNEYGVGKGILCLGCFERRMGRPLRLSDLNPNVNCNKAFFIWPRHGIMRVWVYRNLKHGKQSTPLYSVMHKGKVIARKHRVLLSGVKFIVRESGRQRVLKEKRKNVHAFVVGDLVGKEGAFGIDENGPDLPCQVRYNPYDRGDFVYGKTAVKGALGALLNEHGISATYLSC